MAEQRRNRRPMGGGHGHGGMGNGEKAKDFKGTMKKLFKEMMRFKLSIFIVAIFAAGSTVFTVIGPDISSKATDELKDGFSRKLSNTGSIDFDRIGELLLLLLILYGLSALFAFIQGFVMAGVVQKLTYGFRQRMSEKIHRMPMKYFEKNTTGEVLSRFTNDIDTLSQGLNQSITTLITSLVSIVGILYMMFRISVVMTIVSIVILPVSVLFTGIVIKKSQKHFKNQQKYLGDVNGQVEEVYGGQIIVKAFNKEKDVIDTFNKTNDKLYESAWKSQFLSGLMMPMMNFVTNIGYVLVAVLGGYYNIKKKMTIGDIVAFIQYSRNFTQPITQMTQVVNMLQSTAAAAERVFELLDEEEEDQIVENPVDISKLEGNVEFKNVKFGYDEDKIIINDFSAKVKEGQKIAIVGPTGAGKTTMVKLLMRFYDVNSGEVLVDGHNIKDFNRTELREMFGMVLQDTWLFNGSIMDNIRYSKLDATDEEVIEAAKAAHAHRFIKTLPDGYNMVLNEELTNVSQGQKQLLTIARAILADPKILILDEATSSVDTRTEIRIQKAMDNLMKGRTSFIIAHRLSTIRDADMILVMKDGDIVEMGNHDELLEKDGFYASLYKSQFDVAS